MNVAEPVVERSSLARTPAESRYMFLGLAGTGIMYAMAGVFAILASLVLATLPLNTPGVYDVIGRMQHVYQIRWFTSSALFGIGAATIIVGYIYSLTPAAPWKTLAARIVAFIHQPWIPLVFIVIAVMWLVQGFDADGDIAQFFAGPLGIDVETQAGRLQYLYIIGTMPSMSFLFYGLLSLMLFPFSFYSSAVVLQDTGAALSRKGRVDPVPYDRRAKMYACKGLLLGGFVYIVIGLVFYVIGFVMGIGLDATYPALSAWDYRLYMDVYPWIPVAFGIACIAIAFMYHAKPGVPAFRVAAWTTVFVQCVIPLVGWFLAIVLGRELWASGRAASPSTAKRQMLVGMIVALVIVVVSLLVVIVVRG